MLLNKWVHKKKEWTVVSRDSIKRFLVETVTDIGQSQPFLFLKNGLQMLKEKALEMIP